MKKWMGVLLLFAVHTAFADESILKVGVISFYPPYVLQTDKNDFSGLGIAVMEYICKKINRKCQYITLERKELLSAVIYRKVDAVIGGIVINKELDGLVLMSKPYMASEGLFIGAKFENNQFDPKNFSHNIGIVTNNKAYSDKLIDLGIPRDQLISYESEIAVVNAIIQGEISYGFINDETAEYWVHSNLNPRLHCLGQPIEVGNGVGIAINLKDKALLDQINRAIDDYVNSPLFELNYKLYVNTFPEERKY